MASHLGEMLTESVTRFGSRPALRVRQGDDWRVQTYAELGADAAKLAAALVSMGVGHGDRVAIFSENRPEWTVADFATLLIGGVVVPIYQTSTRRQTRHILSDSGARVVFASAAAIDTLDGIEDELEQNLTVIGLDGAQRQAGAATAYADLLAAEPAHDPELEARLAAVTGDDIATIIYTSGTTAEPKGVVLTHHAFIWEIEAVRSFFDITEHDHSLCFLPLAHALERAWTFVVMTCGAMNTYLPDARAVAEMMPLAQPTLMVSVPKLYERIFAIAHERAAANRATKTIFDWGLTVGRRAAEHRAAQPDTPLPRRLQAQLKIADRLVLSNVRDAIGGPKTVLASGGAPLRREVEEFFHDAGILVCQGYGLTEAAPLVSFNSPSAYKFGTVGRPNPGSEISVTDEGEIRYRAPNVMRGYWRQDEATAATLVDGWLMTGDLGHIDDDGYLVITGRAKDIIVTEGGRNIAPSPLEEALTTDSLIDHALVVGDNRPCLTALVRPNNETLRGWAEREGVTFSDLAEVLRESRLRKVLEERVAEISQQFARHEQIRQIDLIDEEPDQENRLLTPTLKLRRREVEERYAAKIQAMYEKIAARQR